MVTVQTGAAFVFALIVQRFKVVKMQISKHSLVIERTFQGAWRISSMINGYLVSEQYMGYTKRDAISMFQSTHRDNE